MLQGVTLKDSIGWRIVRNYMERLSSLRWQTLEVLSPHYRNPVGGIGEIIVGWRERVQQEMPHCQIYPLSDMKRFLSAERIEEEEEHFDIFRSDRTEAEEEHGTDEEEDHFDI